MSSSESTLRSDIQHALAHPGELASAEQVAELERKLNAHRMMKHFDDGSFRNFLLLSYRSLFEALADGELQQLEDAWCALSPEAQSVAQEVCDDFSQLLATEERLQRILQTVEVWMQKREFGKALYLLRANACFLSAEVLRSYRARIWSLVAEVDSRFTDVAEGFSKYEPPA